MLLASGCCAGFSHLICCIRHTAFRRLLLFLAERQNVGEQIGAEQCAQPLAENDNGREHIDDDKRHREIDRSHDRRAEQEAHAEHDGIFEHGSDGVVEPRKQREYVHQDDGVCDHGDEEDRCRDSPEGVLKPHVVEDIAVKSENDPRGEQDEPDDRALPEIGLK